MNLLPGISDRACFIGMTGSGKTTAIAYFVMQVHNRLRVLILDTKGDDTLLVPGHAYVEHAGEIDAAMRDSPTVVYRPIVDEMVDPDLLDAVLEESYQRGNTLTVIDEISMVAPGARPRRGLLNLYARGRARNAHGRTLHSPAWSGSQRAAWVPRHVYNQSTRFFVFNIADGRDRDVVATFTHPDMRQLPRKLYGFRYYQTGALKSYEFGPVPLPLRRSLPRPREDSRDRVASR